jgi:hypothetical protein
VWTGTRRTTVPSYDTTIQILPYHGLTGSPVASPSPHCTRTAIPPSIVLDRTWPTLHAPRSSIDHGNNSVVQNNTTHQDAGILPVSACTLSRSYGRACDAGLSQGPLFSARCIQAAATSRSLPCSVRVPRAGRGSSVFLTEHMVRGRPSGMAGGRIIAWKRQRSVVFRSAST